MADPTSARAEAPRRPLAEFLPAAGSGPDAFFDALVEWVADRQLELYPAQEQAILELLAGRHVILQTPTGSGKSLVALALHAKALSEKRRSFYTAPTKALVSEKFFALCAELGPANVGMLTGDASLNWAAPVICCTAEVLANMALRQGEATDAPYVVMDEFHYFADRERGIAWQVPLLALPRTTFLLMSATLGNTARIAERIQARTGRAVAEVYSEDRPVPLDFEYRETPLHETVEALLEQGRAPVYLVNFTQRECAEQAQALTSASVASREERRRIADEVAGFRFDSPYGTDVKRFLSHGIGIHHAGLLPKYRLLVEQLSQQGLLKVISGTDTLGVGVNIPIRTVLFTRLSKYDGQKVSLLSARDFKQIAGRAGRRGFDVRGSVVCQAPEHVIENARLAARGAGSGGKKPPKRPPPRGFVPWTRQTFEELIARPPEPLASRFEVTHGMIVQCLQREGPSGGEGYRALLELVELSYEEPRRKARLRRDAAQRFRSLRRAGLVAIVRDPATRRPRPRVREDLQRDFSLHHTLSLFLFEAVSVLDPASETYAHDVLSAVESILEDPDPVLRAQQKRARDERLAELKAEGVPFDERIQRLDEVTYPRPLAEFLSAAFRLFAETHPWVRAEDVRPKSIAREIAESCSSFDAYVKLYGLARVEGLVLRYLGDAYATLARSVPESARTDELVELLAFLRALVAGVDSSLLREWEGLMRPEGAAAPEPKETAPPRRRPLDLARDPRSFAARVRAELHGLVACLARRDFEGALGWLRADPEDPWTAERLARELEPYFAEHGRIETTPAALRPQHTLLRELAPGRYDVHQTLVDPAGDGFWSVEGEIDLEAIEDPDERLVRLRRIGT
jgi:superfamily II RNA helicase